MRGRTALARDQRRCCLRAARIHHSCGIRTPRRRPTSSLGSNVDSGGRDTLHVVRRSINRQRTQLAGHLRRPFRSRPGGRSRQAAARPVHFRPMIFKSPHPDVTIPDTALTPFVMQGLCCRKSRAAQEDPASRDHRADPQISDRQDPPPCAQGARESRSWPSVGSHALVRWGGMSGPLST